MGWRAFWPGAPCFSDGALASGGTGAEGGTECLGQEPQQPRGRAGAGAGPLPGPETWGQGGAPLHPHPLSFLLPLPRPKVGGSCYKAGKGGKPEVLGTTPHERRKLEEKGVWGTLTLEAGSLQICFELSRTFTVCRQLALRKSLSPW